MQDRYSAQSRAKDLLKTCLAHLNPFELYAGAPGLSSRSVPPRCPAPSCGAILTKVFIEKEPRKMEEISVQKLSEHLRNHRKAHYGKEKHAELLLCVDHADRAPSLLRHRINTCASLIAITFANRATPGTKRKMNEVLRSYGEKWTFSEKKGQLDTRPSGNESRMAAATTNPTAGRRRSMR
eukprot:6038373-Pleurochrysis_carterae.AAC.1